MSNTEHLDRIIAKCRANLAQAQNRLRDWAAESGRIIQRNNSPNTIAENVFHHATREFLLEVDKSAEAGWRATIAAIEAISRVGSVFGYAAQVIIAAWPEELL